MAIERATRDGQNGAKGQWQRRKEACVRVCVLSAPLVGCVCACAYVCEGPNGCWQIAGLWPDPCLYQTCGWAEWRGADGPRPETGPWGRQRNPLKHKRDDNNV